MSEVGSMQAESALPGTTVHHVSARARRRRRRAPWQMTLNLTAMVDVVFLLLIYFVVTAGFARPEGALTMNLPGGPVRRDPLALPLEKITIMLAPVGASGCRITVYGINGSGGERIKSFSALGKLLAAVQYDPGRGERSGRFRPNNPMVIAALGKVRWQHVVNAFNAAVKDRYTNVAFARVKGSTGRHQAD